MNTAVDEDDGDEEEEEIGWDDDDDEEEEEQIVFDDNTGGPVMAMASSKLQRSTMEHNHQVNKDSVDHANEAALQLEQLQEQLKQAIEERDILHQTVSLQTKEIASLKSVAGSAATPESDPNENKISDVAPTNIIPQDSLNTDDNENGMMWQSQVQELNEVIRDRENQILEMTSRHETERNILQDRVNELQLRNDELQERIQELERAASIERKDMNETLKRLEAEKVELKAQVQTAQSDIVMSQTKIIDLQTELNTTQDQLKMANERHSVESYPVTTEDNIVTDATTNMSSSGELTTATGVKVASPSPSPPIPPPSTVVSKITHVKDDEEEEEGWGDDWD
jgi:DNA repair exonuclease SbcCD ATPase subunit